MINFIQFDIQFAFANHDCNIVANQYA